jgi:hypothetical protein
VALSASVLLGGWLQGKVEAGAIQPWLVFLLTGIPPLVTAAVGLRNIDEPRVAPEERPRLGLRARLEQLRRSGPALDRLRGWRARFRAFRRENRPIWLLALFIFFWNFSPSIGYIERSYLIDVRDFSALSFGIILAAGSLVFLASILAYRLVVRLFPGVRWDQYLYAMVALAVLAFPLSFFLYLDPDHPWWDYVDFTLPEALNPLPDWNRYQWFRLIFQTVLGFASIPAFLIPLTVAGETVKLEYAGMGYAFLTALSNATNMIEGVVGAGLYYVFSQPWMASLIGAFGGSPLDIAGTADQRTLILEMFVYVSLLFTLLAVPFLVLLKRELARRDITIRLGGSEPAAG